MQACPECKAAVESVTPFAWKGDGVETRFLCGSCSANSGFTQSDRCRIASLTEELERVKKLPGELLADLDLHWQFDNWQVHTHTWHAKQDFLDKWHAKLKEAPQ